MERFRSRLKRWAPEPLLRVWRALRRAWRRRRRNALPLSWRLFGSLRRTRPIRRHFGWGHGTPVDRHYVERFLAAHASDIRGRVLEVGDRGYTERFGADRVSRSDVLHVEEGNPEATIVGDLTESSTLEREAYDCVILTFVLADIFEVRDALRSVHRSLRPGGVLLVAEHGIRSVSRYDYDRWGDHWRFTSLSLDRLLREAFPGGEVEVAAHGNVLAAVAFLHGLLAEELDDEELSVRDPDFELVLTARAVKSSGGSGG
jgi:SAM-dependent methyltransferase